MKGIIALDIDGTITVDHHRIDPDVVCFFRKLSREGWQFIFITGRTFAWGYHVLKAMPFSYYFAVQNGAIILKMPERMVVSKKYLDKNIIPPMEEICRGEPSDFVIYTGCENNDACYYRPGHFAKDLLEYLRSRKDTLKENWLPLESFASLPVEEFPSLKCFGTEEDVDRITLKIESRLGLHVPSIRDPFNMQYYVAQATHPEVSKGYALKDLSSLLKCEGKTIAAGDDNNDRSMLAVADIKIAMATAPAVMLEQADIVAPSASENGIIKGLTLAVERMDDKKRR